MLPSDLARTVIAAVTILVSPAVAVAVVAWAEARLRGRRRSAWIEPVVAVVAGLWIGVALLVGDARPEARLLGLVAGGAIVAAAFVTGRRLMAGLVLVAAAGWWTLSWSSFVLDNLVAGGHWQIGEIASRIVAGLAALAAGGLLTLDGSRDRPRQLVEPERLPERRFDAVSRATAGPTILGTNLHEGAMAGVISAAAVITALVAHGASPVVTLMIGSAGVAASTIGAGLAWALVRAAPGRAAFEAFAWLGERELERFAAIAPAYAPPTPRTLRKWARESPEAVDDRWVRWGVLTLEGRLDEARRVAEGIPDDTPFGSLERAAAIDAVDWLAGGTADLAAVRTAAAAVPDSDAEQRLQADVILAIAETRHRIGAGDAEAIRPLVEARRRLGARADGLLLWIVRRRLARRLFLLSIYLVVGALTLDRLQPLF